MPGAGTGEYIDRVAEEVAARSRGRGRGERRGRLLRPTDGLMVTRFVEGAATMNAERFSDLDAVGPRGRGVPQAAHHRSPVRHRLRAVLDDRRLQGACSRRRGHELPDGYDELPGEAETHERADSRHGPATRAVALRPAVRELPRHRRADVGRSTTSTRGNNDPMWDLGDLSVEGEFGAGAGRGSCSPPISAASPGASEARAGWSPTRRCATCSGRCGA